MNFIIEKFNKIVSDSCERFGKECGVGGEQMQVLFRLNEEADVVYSVLKEYRPYKEVSFNEILNVKIDFRGYSLIVPPYIQKTLIQYSESMEVYYTELSVMCVLNELKKVILCLYKGKDFVKEINLEEEF